MIDLNSINGTKKSVFKTIRSYDEEPVSEVLNPAFVCAFCINNNNTCLISQTKSSAQVTNTAAVKSS